MQMILDISDLLKKPAWTQTDDYIDKTGSNDTIQSNCVKGMSS